MLDLLNRDYNNNNNNNINNHLSLYLKGKTNLDFSEARESEWMWHQLGHMQICTSPQTDASTQPLNFSQAECPSCCPINSIKALKATLKQGVHGIKRCIF